MNSRRVSFYYNEEPSKQGMYFEDEDSRDSGLGDMDCGPSSLKSCGENTLFILDEEMEDLAINENSVKQMPRKMSKDFSRCPRTFGGDFTNMQETSPLSRRSGMYKAKSTMLPRKRTLPNIDYQPKRQKEEGAKENDENCQPSNSSVVCGRPRTLLRAFSTSSIEVHPHPDDHLPQALVVDYSLPTITNSTDSVAYRRIEAPTLCQLMSSMSEADFRERYVLIDCRYPYEYEGGHIGGAINMYDPNECEKFFFDGDFDRKRIPIFYCEYSQKRGPGMATALRGFDRIRNVDNYPHVTFEEIYVLDKGYKGFYNNNAAPLFQSRSFCQPESYTTMDDPQFNHILKTFNFHKRYSTTATCIKPENKSRIKMARQLSLESPSRRPARRPLFSVTESPLPSLAPQKLTFSPDSPISRC